MNDESSQSQTINLSSSSGGEASANTGDRAIAQALIWPGALKLLREFLVVVLGVIVALALDSYVEHRREQQLERGYYERLEGDIEANQQLLRTLVGYWKSNASSAERFLSFLEGRTADRPVDLLVAAVLAASITLPNLSTPTYDELIASSSLGILRDGDARRAVVEYQRTLQYGDPFIARLQAARAYDEIIYRGVPAGLIGIIMEQCRIPERPCELPIDDAGADALVKAIRADASVYGALNWRLYDASRLAEIFEERIQQGDAVLTRLKAASER